MFDIYKTLREIALANVLEPDSEAHYRSICRWYSTTFHTPLHQVKDIDFNEVLLNYFEYFYEKRISASEEQEAEVWVEAMRAINPDYDEEEEAALQDFIRMLEDEEAEKKLKKDPKPVVKTYEEVEAIMAKDASQSSPEPSDDPINALMDLPGDDG